MKNNYRKTLNNELYKLGFGFDFCKEISDAICQISTEGKESEEWKQDIFQGRLQMIKKAIQATLIEEKIKSTSKVTV